MESTHAMLHIVALLDWEIHQMDVKTTFLHGKLEEEVYMEQPEGMKEQGKEDWVCYMHKMLYGLMQAVCAWNLLVLPKFGSVRFRPLFTRTRTGTDSSVQFRSNYIS